MKDIRPILNEKGIEYKESGRGWINLCCPFCSDSKFHLGYNAEFSVFSCYRCGRHKFFETLSLLTNEKAKDLSETVRKSYKLSQDKEKENFVRKSEFEYPKEVIPLQTIHKEYLKRRNYNPSLLQSVWGVMGTSKSGRYSNRIVIPVVFKSRIVSFMARDITEKSEAKILFCDKENELIPAKNLLHGYDLAIKNWVLVTEGPFDAFRFGPGAVDTMGIKFTESQVSLLKGFANVFILFDSRIDHNGFETEKQAQEQAEKLADLLSPFCNVWILNEFRSDLGDMDNFQILKIKQAIKKALVEQRRKENV